jgi:hypothetical protein
VYDFDLSGIKINKNWMTNMYNVDKEYFNQTRGKRGDVTSGQCIILLLFCVIKMLPSGSVCANATITGPQLS